MPTMRCEMRRLLPGAVTTTDRQTGTRVSAVLDGHGVVELGGRSFDLAAEPGGRASVGQLDEDGRVVDLSALRAHAPAGGALRSLLTALDGAPVTTTTHHHAEVFDLAEVTLQPVVPDPPKGWPAVLGRWAFAGPRSGWEVRA
jgi:hypothetical protein